jgi:hypothetical protein
MSDYGVKPEGFLIKPLEKIREDIVARLVASPDVGPSQDYSDTDPLGQIIGSFSSEIAEVWELGFAVHTSGDPEGALDVPLDQLLSLTGSERLAARPSRVEGALLTLDAGAIVAAGAQVSVTGRPDITFTLDAEVKNETPDPGDFSGDFTCTVDGPVNVNAGTLEVIDTSVSGWTAVTNPDDAIPGRLAAGNIEYRQRWSDERAQQGSTTVSAIRAALLNTDDDTGHPEFATIEKVLVLQNKKDVVDDNGLPPHSVEAIIDDGETPSVDDDLIAQVLWDNGIAGGIDSYGNQSGTAIDSEGVEQTVYFSRVTRRNIYITLSLTRTTSFPVDGDAKVKTALATAGNGYDVDEDVIALFIKAQALTVAGVTDVPDFAIGLAALPVADDNLPMGYRERAAFSTARITISNPA